MKHLYPHVFGSGPTITSPLSLRHYAKRMVLPCGFTTVGDMNWTPAMQLESTDPSLWMRFWEEDYSVSTGGARDFEAASSAQATRASFAAVNLSTTDFSIVSNLHRETTGNMVIAAKYQDADNYWRWEVTAGHKLHFIAVVATTTLIEVTGTTLLDSLATWYHAAVVVDRDGAGTTEIYLNGVNDTAGVPTVSATSIDNTGAFFLGESGAGTLFYDGRLSRVGVLKADLLTQAEITWLYNLGRSRIHGSLGEVGTDGASLAPTWWANCNETATAGDVVDQVAAANLATAVGLPAVDGPDADIAPDTGSVGTAHGQLIGFADSETARSTDVPSAIGSGTSLVFDGVDDRVDASSAGFPTAAASMSAWVKRSNTGYATIAATNANGAWNNGYGFVCQSTGKLSFYVSTYADATTAIEDTRLNDSAWHHYCGTWDGTTVKLYVDGVLQADTGTYSSAVSHTSMTFGNDTLSSSALSGKLDDVQIFDSALSLAQIAELYANTAVTGASPIHKWTFDEETSLSVTDGDPIAIAQSLEGSRYQLLNATASERPDYVASAINSKPGLEFDGVDDLLEYVGVPLTGTAGTVIAICKVKAVPDAYQTLLASSDTATATKYLALHIRGNTANGHIGYGQNNAGTEDLLDGDTAVTDELDCAVYWASNGTTVTARLNGTAQTLNADTGANNGDWWDDSTGKDTTTIGALKHTSETNHAAIILCELIAYPINLSDASRAKFAAYVLREYGLTL